MKSKLSKKFRIEVLEEAAAPTRGKKSKQKGKPKALPVIIWDGESDPLPIVQRRCGECVKSLRDKQSGTELDRSGLQALPNNSIIVGSTRASTMAAAIRATDQPDVVEQDDIVSFGKAEVQNFTLPRMNNHEDPVDPESLDQRHSLSRHAKKRMHRQGISEQEIVECLQRGDRQRAGKGIERVTHESLVTLQAKDAQKTVITTTRDLSKTLPMSRYKASHCLRSGLVQAMQEQLRIIINYKEEEEAFELRGDERGIDRAIQRFEKTAFNSASEIRVPSTRDMCGQIIGKGGANIDAIRKKLDIQHPLAVRWDGESKEMVVACLVPLTKHVEAQLTLAVEAIVERITQAHYINTTPHKVAD